MENNYLLNPAIKLLLEAIEPGSVEKEVQALVENVVWTVFPATDGWINLTKYKQGATEPDEKTMKVVLTPAGYAHVDLLMWELKRNQENKSATAFDRFARDLLMDFLWESGNPADSIIFGAVGIGDHVKFYQRKIPDGPMEQLHQDPLHWVRGAQLIQQIFDHIKVNIPKLPETAAPGSAAQPGSRAPAAGGVGDWSAWCWDDENQRFIRSRENPAARSGWENEYEY